MTYSLPARVTALFDQRALVDIGGAYCTVVCPPDVNAVIGDWVLVNSGRAVRTLSPSEIQATYAALHDLSDLLVLPEEPLEEDDEEAEAELA